MNALGHTLLIPLYLVMFLMDVAIFFLVVRLLKYVIPVKPLEFLDQVGGKAVDVVSGAIAHELRRWSKRPLTERQEEAAALFILSVVRWLLAVAVR